jgi:hypothetical protein
MKLTEAFKCSCRNGFFLKKDNKTCEKVHPCDRKEKGGCQQACVKDGNKFECKCKHPEFKLAEDGKNCIPFTHATDRTNAKEYVTRKEMDSSAAVLLIKSSNKMDPVNQSIHVIEPTMVNVLISA